MPAAAARARRDTAQGGGTSVPDGAGPRWSGVALAVAAVAVIAAVVALVATRGSASKPVTPAPTVEPVAPPEPAARVIDDGPTAPAPPPPALDPYPVLDRLERLLAAERLYAKTSVSGAIVEVRSSFCDQPRTRALIDQALPALHAQGVTRVACVELHGAVVFVRAL